MPLASGLLQLLYFYIKAQDIIPDILIIQHPPSHNVKPPPVSHNIWIMCLMNVFRTKQSGKPTAAETVFPYGVSLRLFLPLSSSHNQVSHGVSPARMCSHKSCSHTTCNLTMQEKQHGTRRDEEGEKGGIENKGNMRHSWHSSWRTAEACRHVTLGKREMKNISKQRACWRRHILPRLCHLFSLPDKHVLSQRCARGRGRHSESAPSRSPNRCLPLSASSSHTHTHTFISPWMPCHWLEERSICISLPLCLWTHMQIHVTVCVCVCVCGCVCLLCVKIQYMYLLTS